MPRVIIQARKGRTLAQKRGLVRALTDAVCANFDVRPDQVTIVIQEADEENYAKGGVLDVDRADVARAPVSAK
jgi:4-oxalocrotonate tautomerase